MSNPQLLWSLPEIDRSEHFIFRGIWRNPAPNGFACRHFNNVTHGIRDPAIVALYKRVLEDAYTKFAAAGREPPDFEYGEGLGKLIPVFLIAADAGSAECSSPFAHGEIIAEVGKWAPYMVLPVRGLFATREAEWEAFEAIAVHELSHVFNMQILPQRRVPNERMPIESRYWIWFDEGVATADESWVLPENTAWMIFSLGWLDFPERSLDDEDAWYQAALFVRYASRRMAEAGHPNFAYDVWKLARQVWQAVDGQLEEEGRPVQSIRALEAIEKYFRSHNLEFCSKQPSVKDVFASGFCMHSYFLWYPNPNGTEKDVDARFPGGRAVADSMRVTAGTIAESGPWPLSHLACRYFRIYPPDSPIRIRVRVDLGDVEQCNLKVEMAIVARQSLAPARTEPISFSEVADENGRRFFAGEELEISAETCDHVVVVVTNCAMNKSTVHSGEFDSFTIIAMDAG